MPNIIIKLLWFQLTSLHLIPRYGYKNTLTKIEEASVLNVNELAIIESRFFTKKEVSRRRLNGLRLFPENPSVDESTIFISGQAVLIINKNHLSDKSCPRCQRSTQVDCHIL